MIKLIIYPEDIDPKILKEFHDIFDEEKKRYLAYLSKIIESELHFSRDLSIVFCSDPFIHSYNKTYRKKDMPTDVLSFITDEELSIEQTPYIGDILISLDTAKRQSIEYETSFLEEILRLSIHGILHLLRYDHEISKEEEKIMFEKQDLYLERYFIK